jgi:hypothetical protein
MSLRPLAVEQGAGIVADAAGRVAVEVEADAVVTEVVARGEAPGRGVRGGVRLCASEPARGIGREDS